LILEGQKKKSHRKRRSEEMFCFEVMDVLSCGPQASSVQCCGSGMFIPYPDFNHPGCNNSNKRGICGPTFFVATNITKIKIVLFFFIF
jgi:hypothetical protein